MGRLEELRPMPFGHERDDQRPPLAAGALVHPVGQVTTASRALRWPEMAR